MKLSKVFFRGIEGYITDLRIPHADRKHDLFYYEIRHSDEDFWEPVTIEPSVIVNNWGTIVFKLPIDHMMDTSTHWHQIELTDQESNNLQAAIGAGEVIDHKDI